MMHIKINWEKLRRTYNNLLEWPNISLETDITFLIVLADRSHKKVVIKMQSFLPFIWALSENKDFKIMTFLVQDSDGRTLYRHNIMTKGNEEIPIGGNSHILLGWNTLTEEKREAFLKILISQIDSYEQQTD